MPSTARRQGALPPFSGLPSAGHLTLMTLAFCGLGFLDGGGLPHEHEARRGCSLKSSLSFTQELPKYLRGFHKCSQEDAVHLAGLIYKAQFGDDRSQLASMPKVLRELVPENLTRLMSSEEWKKVFGRGWEGAPRLLPPQGPHPGATVGGGLGPL